MAQRRDALDQLLITLNVSGIQRTNTPLYEVIKALIGRLKELSLEDGGSGSSTTIINQIGISGAPGMQGDDGDDGSIGPQGIQGIQGAIGNVGPAGPVTLGPMGLDGNDSDDGVPIPGQIGAPGPKGDTGSTGPPAPYILPVDGLDGDDGISIPGRNGDSANADWQLLNTTTITVAGVNFDVPGLAGYNEILVIIDGITRSITGITTLRLSIDNGATFLATAADYIDVSTAGVEAGIDRIPFHTTNSTLARSGRVLIRLFDTTSPVKMAESWDGNNYFLPSASAFNAIRVYSGSAGGNLTGGVIYVYGR